MKKLFFLFSFIFLFSNVQGQELAYAETSSSMLSSTVEWGVSSIYKDSLFWVVAIDIRPVEGSWNSKATFTTKQSTSKFSKGTKGIGQLEVTGSRTGRLKITEISGRKISRSQTVDLTFKSRPPSLR